MWQFVWSLALYLAGPPSAPKSDVVLSIDAGPVAKGLVTHGEPTPLTDKQAERACAATKSDGLYADTCDVSRLGRAANADLGLLYHSGGDCPDAGEAYHVGTLTSRGDWKELVEIGSGHCSVESASEVSVHGRGSADLGAVGRWAWVDIMEEHHGITRGTEWERALWLCGGTDAVACWRVPLKSWWSKKVPDYLDQRAPDLERTNPGVPMYALAISLGADGTITMTAKTEAVPPDILPLLGTWPLSAIASKGLRQAP